MQTVRAWVCALGVLLPVLPVHAQDLPGDVEAGRTFAESNCVMCHPTGPNRSIVDTPTLFEIATKPGMTETALIAWLTGISHPTMPNLILTPSQTEDVVSYILSLKQERGVR